MVRVNFRMNDGIENQQILQFFKDIGYEHIASENKSIKVEDEIIPTEVFVRNTQSGRYHLNIAFGNKYSGHIKFPQVKVFAHFDINKIIGGKEKHIPDRNEKRNLKEMYRIGKKIEAKKLGFLEEKDQKCAHGTLNGENKNQLMEFLKAENYKRYAIGKYRKRLNGAQFTLAIFEQEKYIHIVCVYAKIVRGYHNLNKYKALEEIKRIEQFIKKMNRLTRNKLC